MDQLNTKFSVRKPTKSDDEDSFPPPPPVGTPPEFTSIDGRRYSNKGNASYILPNDNTESTRLNSQHYQSRYLFQGSFNSPMTEELKKGIKVLDVGCGTVATALRMRDIDTTVIARLEPMFVSAGIGPVTHLSTQWPLGWDPTNTQYTKMSKEGIKPQILAALGIADKEYTKHFDNVELEFGEYKPHFDLEFYYGRKNGASKSS
ncbi:hypothetical protein BC938DRAFT_482270 [Jimgerdemannia flammicorona]|uniref:S-adenosyl-L-methionine-dependent methyltransferase n=1 Tax=Jimgerdemannia flammicorona TaxID=994334 RepID=A0A433QEC8_9FUNG|nr:hypothetical protein BC938DRAFT_482270 [Jimgerdemannia flammicorona]